MPKKIWIVVGCAAVCLIGALIYRQATVPPPPGEDLPVRTYQPAVPLSPQETFLLLDHFNPAITDREAKLKSGSVEFTLTLSRPDDIFSKKPVYQERKRWEVTYKFSGQNGFYEIQEQVKVKPGWLQRPKWKESKRYKVQVEPGKEHRRVNRGDGWKPTTRHPIDMGNYSSPLGWKWDTNLTRMTRWFGTIVEIQDVVVDGEPRHYLKFEQWGADMFEITELWLHPEKDYRTTEVYSGDGTLAKMHRPKRS